MEISKYACPLAKIEGTMLAEAKEEGTRLPPGTAAGQGGAAAVLPTFPLGRSWLLLEGSKKKAARRLTFLLPCPGTSRRYLYILGRFRA